MSLWETSKWDGAARVRLGDDAAAPSSIPMMVWAAILCCFALPFSFYLLPSVKIVAIDLLSAYFRFFVDCRVGIIVSQGDQTYSTNMGRGAWQYFYSIRIIRSKYGRSRLSLYQSFNEF